MDKQSKTDRFIYQLAVLAAGIGWFAMVGMLNDGSVGKGWRWLAASLLSGSLVLFYYDHRTIDSLEKEAETRRVVDEYAETLKKHKK